MTYKYTYKICICDTMLTVTTTYFYTVCQHNSGSLQFCLDWTSQKVFLDIFKMSFFSTNVIIMKPKTGRKGVPHENPIFPLKNNSFFPTPYSMPFYKARHVFCQHIEKTHFRPIFMTILYQSSPQSHTKNKGRGAGEGIRAKPESRLGSEAPLTVGSLQN